jgi:hypothetical protein
MLTAHVYILEWQANGAQGSIETALASVADSSQVLFTWEFYAY